jgi:hypothetical protein
MVKWQEFYSGPRTVFTENFDALVPSRTLDYRRTKLTRVNGHPNLLAASLPDTQSLRRWHSGRIWVAARVRVSGAVAPNPR